MNKIGYKLGGDFYDIGRNGYGVGFEILFPNVYETEDAAEQANGKIRASMEKEPNGSVVIRLYEDDSLVENIKWDEWWKYRCYRIKEAMKDVLCVEGHSDFEPCSEKFEDIFAGYIGDRDPTRTKFSMQYLSYWTEPAVIGADD